MSKRCGSCGRLFDVTTYEKTGTMAEVTRGERDSVFETETNPPGVHFCPFCGNTPI